MHCGIELAEMVAGPFCNGGPVNVMMELLLLTESKKTGCSRLPVPTNRKHLNAACLILLLLLFFILDSISVSFG